MDEEGATETSQKIFLYVWVLEEKKYWIQMEGVGID